ncbi:VOC family protein [Lentibacter algarum]|uniref:VOC family protein n=1 Tax=Lentibacter algarum TaxID=576131 RepID=UPI001C08193C|nr:VOC family protein [Lentibacter algarum]MBU2983698.1 VOC family protein [Lentibacter algarum]
MVQVTELGYLGLSVSDMPAWKAFATDILAMEIAEGATDQLCQLRADYWHRRIDLVATGEDNIAYFGLRVAGREEFSQMQDQLTAAGIDFRVGTVEEAQERKVTAILKMKDPDGYNVEIFHGPCVERHKPFHPGRRMHHNYVLGTAGLGHIVLGQKDVEAAYRFYTALGMRGDVEYPNEQGGIENGPTFMGCNDRDHTIAFGMGDEHRIYHLGLQFESFDDFGLTYDTAMEKGVGFFFHPGRHSNDNMVSFYVHTPSDWLIEMGWGGNVGPKPQSEYYPDDIFGHHHQHKDGSLSKLS